MRLSRLHLLQAACVANRTACLSEDGKPAVGNPSSAVHHFVWFSMNRTRIMCTLASPNSHHVHWASPARSATTATCHWAAIGRYGCTLCADAALWYPLLGGAPCACAEPVRVHVCVCFFGRLMARRQGCVCVPFWPVGAAAGPCWHGDKDACVCLWAC